MDPARTATLKLIASPENAGAGLGSIPTETSAVDETVGSDGTAVGLVVVDAEGCAVAAGVFVAEGVAVALMHPLTRAAATVKAPARRTSRRTTFSISVLRRLAMAASGARRVEWHVS
jgi:hypothetical protein